MDKILRRVALGITIIVSLFCLYVTIDCIRLHDSVDFTKPLITISEEIAEDSVTYNGIGYKIVYDVGSTGCNGANLYVFDNFFVYGWIE